MKIAVVGGHMAPAVGFIHSLPQSVSVVYFGRKHVFEGDSGLSLEAKTVTNMGIPFFSLQAGRVQRVFTKHTIPSLVKIPLGFIQALAILRKESPDTVVGFGGYLSVPVGLAAFFLHIPLIIHESTQGAGLANKMLVPFAQKVCISWETSRLFFPRDKTVMTGDPMLPFDSPIPKDLLPASSKTLPLVMVSGGSGGAHAINMLIAAILPSLLEKARVLHITGDAREFNDYKILGEKRQALPEELREHYRLVKFIDPLVINSVFAKADLVIGRSGINTIATMMILRKKMLCIPLSVGQKNEQLNNALLLEKEGLATIVNQEMVSPDDLVREIENLLNKKITSPEPLELKNAGEKLYKEVQLCVQKFHNAE